jgi:uncharacterized protein (UPF0332 family)
VTRSETAAIFLRKARQNLEAARLLLNTGLHDATANRAYYAAFQALTAALLCEGFQPPPGTFCWSHSTLQSLVAQLTRRRKLYPSSWAGTLPALQYTRDVADYKLAEVSSRLAREAVARSFEIVTGIASRLEVEP